MKARITYGADFDPVQGNPLRTWKVLQEPVSVLRANERLWTVLFSGILGNAEKYKEKEISVEITYRDIEGTTFPPEEFRLDLFPNEGALSLTRKRTVNVMVEEVELGPEG